jgi:hypothetical protein
MDPNCSPARRRWTRWGLPAVLVTAAMLAAACMRPPPRTTTTTTTQGGGPTSSLPPTGGGRLPLTNNTDADGPFPTTVDGSAGANSTVFRPTNLGQDGIKHPIFVWGTGGGSQPSSYNFHFRRLASHGFVIISPNSANVTGQMLQNSLTWIINQNSAVGSVYYGKLDTSRIGMGGHSIGSIATFDAEGRENRLTTTIHVSGGSFDGQGASKIKTPTAFMCGADDTLAGANCTRDFNNTRTPGNPTFFSMLAGTDHIYAARNALPGINAWLRLYLNGETDRKAEFSPGGRYFSGIWSSKVKNWN